MTTLSGLFFSEFSTFKSTQVSNSIRRQSIRFYYIWIFPRTLFSLSVCQEDSKMIHFAEEISAVEDFLLAELIFAFQEISQIFFLELIFAIFCSNDIKI